MSYRELRDFTECVRVLGYPRLVSMDNFRTPNFPLVADILYWMVLRYDPSTSVTVSDDISTEECRIEFLTSIAQVMLSRAAVKLNTKRLYSADGKAVKELLKVAKLLYNAYRTNILNGDNERMVVEELNTENSFEQLQARLPDVKNTRNLASQITESGAKLFDLLNEEREISQEREKCLRFLDAISTNLDSGKEQKGLEQRLNEILESTKEQVSALEKQCKDLASDEKTLQVKIKKKQGELERNDKRLKSLQSVRPAFMDEYEKLEEELQSYYTIYMERFRNLDYLEHLLEEFNKKEREKVQTNERQRKRIQRNAMARKEREIRGDEDDNLFRDDSGSEEVEPTSRDRSETAGRASLKRSEALSSESELSGIEKDDSDLSEESSISGSLSDEDRPRRNKNTKTPASEDEGNFIHEDNDEDHSNSDEDDLSNSEDDINDDNELPTPLSSNSDDDF